jgi:hypothetical protein
MIGKVGEERKQVAGKDWCREESRLKQRAATEETGSGWEVGRLM